MDFLEPFRHRITFLSTFFYYADSGKGLRRVCAIKEWDLLVSFFGAAVIMNLYPEFELERVQQLLPIRQVTGGDWDD
ncbi:hypothetical protein SLT67_19475 [Paenibacillus illinoisensis]|uniref:hypothetical protein n=1 Tax=Paenibacillus illinoisensis TaxID=59845 RepID=UPI003CF5B23C